MKTCYYHHTKQFTNNESHFNKFIVTTVYIDKVFKHTNVINYHNVKVMVVSLSFTEV